MTPTPLDKIGLRWRDHKAALWWLGLLYRSPQKFKDALDKLPPSKRIVAALWLFFHSFFYILFLRIVNHIIVFGIPETAKSALLTSFLNAIYFHSFEILGVILLVTVFVVILLCKGAIIRSVSGWLILALAIAYGFAIGLVTRLHNNIILIIFWTNVSVIISIISLMGISLIKYIISYAYEAMSKIVIFIIAFGITIAIAIGIVGSLTSGIRGSLIVGIVLSIAITISFEVIFGIFIGIAAGIAFGVFGQFYLGITWGIALLSGVLRMYYFPIHFLFISLRKNGHLYRYHPVAWDDLCTLPFLGLARVSELARPRCRLSIKNIKISQLFVVPN